MYVQSYRLHNYVCMYNHTGYIIMYVCTIIHNYACIYNHTGYIVIITPRRACASKGLCDRSCPFIYIFIYIYIYIYIYISLSP